MGRTCQQSAMKKPNRKSILKLVNTTTRSQTSASLAKNGATTNLAAREKNAAVAAADCHQEGAKEYDRKCMKKIIKKDECECDKRVCVVDHSEPPAEFLDGEVCPKDNVKLA